MANNNRSGSNRTEVPQAREALNRFKMEIANEIGVPLKQGYNGDLTSYQNGSVGGEMVRRMIQRQEEAMSGTSSASSGLSSSGAGSQPQAGLGQPGGPQSGSTSQSQGF
mgnify:CR=1 FL=1